MKNRQFETPEQANEQAKERLDLGKRIRARRKQMKLTIAQIAERTGLTVSFLSQVERGKTGISIGSLRAISEVLEVPIFHFLLEEEGSLGMVVRKNERKKLRLPDSHLTYELLVPDLNRSLEFWMGRLEPGAASSDAPKSHPSEECLLVLEGVMEIEIGTQTHVLYPGDSICYDGRIPHRAINRHDRELVFISAVTPPVF
jgi:transcriptional regulator with XRE-family HTH domain